MAVLDEADEMLDMGFREDIEIILKTVPATRQTVFFSATMPKAFMDMTRRFQKNPVVVKATHGKLAAPRIEQEYFEVKETSKMEVLARIIDMYDVRLGLVFCNTKRKVDEVVSHLQTRSYAADGIHGDMNQSQRDRVMNKFRGGAVEILVATDVAARGIDLPELSHVIQYEPPEDPEAYIHRAGRTGRAGGSGTAIMLVNAAERPELLRIGRQFSIPLQERPLPSEEDVERIVSERIITLLEARLRNRDRLQTERMERFLPLARNLSDGEAETSLLAMLLDDFYQETFHAPVVPPGEEQKAAVSRGGGETKGGGSGRPRGGRSRGRSRRSRPGR
jgi:ATP-dependent RNA helicase DeaD